MDRENRLRREDIAAVRGFNRFYTRQLGLLNERLLRSDFSLTEARVLFELAQADETTAAELGRTLRLDSGYLSRILKDFKNRGMLTRAPAAGDARQTVLTLTAARRAAFAPLNEASEQEIAAMIAALSPADRAALVKAMRTAQRLLGGLPEPHVLYILREPRAGDIGWIIHRHAVIYAEEYGWDETFEGFVAEIAADFVKSRDPKRERCWIAEREGEVAGSVFLVRDGETAAKLRLLYVDPSSRGLGIGRRLVAECIRFARAHGYRTVSLWTNDVLVSARRIYEAAGFTLAGEERHRSFGKELVGQNWKLDL
ncbi:MAG: MarR family transcriptional regulator [Alphaproteobacteria bacterium]|nr:MarR family transcriptional regulator [Alphaproteobacteria bacterium]MBV9862728.1 MarR family transcriptional regulator [Alphaproteobacteria bacterium]